MVRGLRTSAPRAESRRAAESWAAVARKGSPSGTAATASATPALRVSRIGRPRINPEANSAPAAPSATGMVRSVIVDSRASTPLSRAGPAVAAMLRPASVAGPVATTTPVPRPPATVVPS